MSYTFNDQPTEKTTPIEPAQLARNPYELTNPYTSYGKLPDIPPPPPIKRKRYSLIWISGIVLLVALVSLSFLGYALYGHASSNIGKTTLPTALPTTRPTIVIETPTPQQVVAYYANDIYNDFVASGYGGTDAKPDTKWSCCTYVPAGGAIYWTDKMIYLITDIMPTWYMPACYLMIKMFLAV